MSFDLLKGGNQPFPINPVLKDIEKLRGIEFESERYALLFVMHNHQLPRLEYDAALPYSEDRRTHGVISKAGIVEGFERFRKAVGELPVLAQGEIPAGMAFDVEVSVLYWLMAV